MYKRFSGRTQTYQVVQYTQTYQDVHNSTCDWANALENSVLLAALSNGYVVNTKDL